MLWFHLQAMQPLREIRQILLWQGYICLTCPTAPAAYNQTLFMSFHCSFSHFHLFCCSRVSWMMETQWLLLRCHKLVVSIFFPLTAPLPGSAVRGYSEGSWQLIPAVLLQQMPVALLYVSPLTVHIDFLLFLAEILSPVITATEKRGPRLLKW